MSKKSSCIKRTHTHTHTDAYKHFCPQQARCCATASVCSSEWQKSNPPLTRDARAFHFWLALPAPVYRKHCGSAAASANDDQNFSTSARPPPTNVRKPASSRDLFLCSSNQLRIYCGGRSGPTRGIGVPGTCPERHFSRGDIFKTVLFIIPIYIYY